ncbi:hypothetical protein EIN_253760 [Entamoeba invadens IP1]|uniref:Uncharacterized protein n=1 Tax=Entamoeba invadens IP1 TaxID=370355 RepID=A0A0A1UHC7_ENTIV|nr:hypothetical protein EIN_253760 [Entamoeba invadens IP1]ELP95092.1 hypothetical protein EIN_253760 [Entamoeba invadens IP1]|eukprot:XP_004261863.1 hypothetical protein EIN_253760 [Entamoeba invadens IP1]
MNIMKKGAGKSGKVTYQERRSNHVLTEVVCIAILDEFASIQIERPSRRTFIAHPFIPIEMVSFDSKDEILFESVVERRIKERMALDMENGVTEQTALRRLKKNRTTESIHLLVDILQEKGIHIGCKHSRGSNNVMVIDYIQSINYKNRVYNIDELEKIGQEIHSHLSLLFEKNKKITLARNDRTLRSFLDH